MITNNTICDDNEISIINPNAKSDIILSMKMIMTIMTTI